MSKKTILIGLVTVAGLAVAAVLTGKNKPPKDDTPLLEGPKSVTREVSDAERRKIAQEWGRKGAAKSAEVRRAKKKQRQTVNELPAQSNLRPDGNGQNVADETPRESPAEA